MNIIFIILPVTFLLGLGFVFAFLKSADSGQFDDLDTPGKRILFGDEVNEVKR